MNKKSKRIQSKKFIFMQYLNPTYWNWEDNKITLFDDWQTNKKEIFEQIYNSVKGMQGFEEIALIVHDKDKKGNCYDAACLYSVMGEKEKALSYLRQSLEDGYRRFAHIKRDRDLINIRNTEEFKVLLKEFEEKHQQEIAAGADGDDSAYELKVEEIPFTKESGVCKVKCAINGLPLHFIFDTGAADVSISSVEATFMAKNDFLSSSDIIGKQNYQTADGNITEGTVINLKDVKLGSLHLNNIKASVVRNQAAPLLLGQSVLSKLGKIEIDNTKNVLRITHKQKIN